MVSREDIESIVSTYELPEDKAKKLIEKSIYLIERRSISSYEGAYALIANLVEGHIPSNEANAVRLDRGFERVTIEDVFKGNPKTREDQERDKVVREAFSKYSSGEKISDDTKKRKLLFDGDPLKYLREHAEYHKLSLTELSGKNNSLYNALRKYEQLKAATEEGLIINDSRITSDQRQEIIDTYNKVEGRLIQARKILHHSNETIKSVWRDAGLKIRKKGGKGFH